MRKKKSVTDRQRQVKRKSWKDKITDEGKALLEMRRRIHDIRPAVIAEFSPAKLDEAFERSQRVWAMEDEYARQFPKTKVIHLEPEFVRLFPMLKSLKAGPNELPQGIAESLEAAQELAMIFEKDLQLRGFAYLMIAALVGRGLKEFFETAKRRIPFGSDHRPEKQMAWFGRGLEMLAKMLQGKPLPKGKMDDELIELIQRIREHEMEKLTWIEMSEALAYAGYYKDADNLRVFAARARKKGLL